MNNRYFPEEEHQEVKTRTYWFLGSILMLMILYLIRAYSLQIGQGDHFKALANSNRTRVVPIAASRGVIYDRHGTPLVNNVPAFNLYVVREDMPNPDEVLHRLAAIIEIDDLKPIQKELAEPKDPYSMIKVRGSLSLNEVAQIEGRLLDLPGIQITAELKRNAIHGRLGAHILGYIGEISKDQISSGRYPQVYQGDMIGQFGIEQTYDSILRGVRGEKWIEVDVLGQERKLLDVKKPVEGNNLFTTLDLPLQTLAEDALGQSAGSIVVMDPNNGDILAMVSHPAFNPNLLSEGASARVMRDLIQDAGHPLMNRSIQGQYPPGSTFKIILSIAALETNEMSPSQQVECHGTFPFGNRVFQDWKKNGHGSVNLHRALVESCDVYFYHTGSRLGVDTIAKFSNMFGLGHRTRVGLASEKSGLIPSTEWKRRALREAWYPGETLSVAIGQGYVLVTPLQMAVMMSAVANGGVLHPPRFFYKSRDRQTGVEQVAANEGKPIPITKETLDMVRNALIDVVATPHGTAAGSRSTLVSFAGKTGTAQVVEIKDRDKRKKLQGVINDHAWFVSYAPAVNPKIAVVVLVEHGGHGASAAAPIAKKLIEAYLAPFPVPVASLPSQKKEAVL
jgi:penicillin-binding protein 2